MTHPLTIYILTLSQKEAESNRIDLPEDHPVLVKKMLDYLYTLDYTDDRNSSVLCIDLAVHVLVYSIADKYSIAGLKDLAMVKMEDSLGFPGHLVTADGTRELLITIELAWTSTPASDKGMREPILKYCKRYLDLLLEMETFKAAMVEIPDMAYDFLAQEVKDRPRR
ncbi:MAG: hypothetical protein ASARMPREDX12_004921 [Alectoria sarmentosa]|nr:MAG: hypothetical protein ASARMPREDX12_004921 [Alectoria sarmentosa]